MDPFQIWDPWKIWFWPWVLTEPAAKTDRRQIAAHRARARARQEEWLSTNRVRIELEGMWLRDFSVDADGRHAALVVAPFSLHEARLADLASGHSLIEALLANGCSSLFLTDWKSATAKTKLRTIDSYLCELNVAVDDLQPPVDLIGLCQGGWLSLLFAARFPGKIRRLVLAGAPVDVMAEPSECSMRASITPDSVINELIRRGDGLVLGHILLDLWRRPQDEISLVFDALQLESRLENEKDRQAFENFGRWHERTVDLPGPYYLEAAKWIFRENRIAKGTFRALGRVISLRELSCPLFLLAGERDTVAPVKQVLATAALVDALRCDIQSAIAPCNHLALFMGRDTLKSEWVRIAEWLRL
jgi:poly(3-hydroxyalkanoate) synthetase